jgi:predicted RNase H-like HicB family nuclease
MSSRRYLIIIEGNGETNYSAYSPDVPGVAATGATQEECEREMRDAITFHLEGLAQDGEPVPEPLSTASYAVVEVG